MMIFDADMKAHPNFLSHVLPYLELDPQTALNFPSASQFLST